MEIQLDTPFTLTLARGPDHSAAYTPGRIQIEFLDVTDDSRCPKDVDCIWQGDATVILKLSGATAQTVKLHTTLAPNKLEFEGYQLSLTQLQPEPELKNPFSREAYKATFVLERINN